MNVIRNLLAIACTLGLFVTTTNAQLFFDFESGSAGWVLSNDFELGSPTGADGSALGAFGGVEPTGGFSGSNVVGTVIGNVHSPSLVSTFSQTFDLTGQSGSMLSFMEWSDSGDNDFDMAEVIVNGSQQYLSDGDSLAAWRLVDVDLSAFDGMSSVDVTFQFTASAAVERVGWYIDDVTVSAVPEPMSFVLLLVGGLGMVGYRRARRS